MKKIFSNKKLFRKNLLKVNEKKNFEFFFSRFENKSDNV